MQPKKCAFHPHLTIVNFCRSPQCLLPMCPACIKIHSAEHTRLKTHGNFDCIDDVHLEVQTTLDTTLKTLQNQTGELKELYKLKENQRNQFIGQLKQMRVKVLEAVNKYIDGLENQILGQLHEVQGAAEQEFQSIDEKIQKTSEQTQKQLYDLNNEKQMKAIIHHLSSNMPNYYGFQTGEITNKINQIKQSKLTIGKQFIGNDISETLKQIGNCYKVVFSDTLQGKSSKKINLVDSGVSKISRECSTQGSFKKVV